MFGAGLSPDSRFVALALAVIFGEFLVFQLMPELFEVYVCFVFSVAPFYLCDFSLIFTRGKMKSALK